MLDYLNYTLNKTTENVINSLTNTLRNDSTNYFSRLDNILKENDFSYEYMERDMIEEMFNYLDNKLENKSLYRVDSEIINGFCTIYEIRKDKNKFPNSQIENYKILASELPKGACKNTLLVKENGKFVIDEGANKVVENKLIKIVENLIKSRNENLKK